MNQSYDKEQYCIKRRRNIIVRFLIKNLDFFARNTIPPSLRNLLYKLMGIHLGKNVFIGLDCMLDSSFPELITIEDNVVISFRVMIICHDDAKPKGSLISNERKKIISPVTLKEGCYIGAGAILLPGITIGRYATVAAGAVVTKDVTDFARVAGIPARPMK